MAPSDPLSRVVPRPVRPVAPRASADLLAATVAAGRPDDTEFVFDIAAMRVLIADLLVVHVHVSLSIGLFWTIAPGAKGMS